MKSGTLIALLASCVVLFQRIALPGTDSKVSISLAILAILSGFIVSRVWRLGRFPGSAIVSTWVVWVVAVSALLLNYESSPLSLAITLVSITALIFLLTASEADTAAFLRGFMIATALLGAGVLMQFLAGFIMGLDLDPISALPKGWSVAGYNTFYDLRYQESSFNLPYKPNGIFAVEPSHASLICGVAAAMAVHRSRGGLSSGVALVFYGAAVVGTMSASGLPALAAALVLSVRHWRVRPSIGLATCTAVAGLAMSPYAAPLSDKALEGFDGPTSSALRLTLPYELLLTPTTSAWGSGPGATRMLVIETGVGGLQSPTALRVFVEYGIPGLCLLVVLCIALLVRGDGWSHRALIGVTLTSWLFIADFLSTPWLIATVAAAVLVGPNGQSEARPEMEEAHEDRRRNR
tara:strand:- start:19 stop:1239 length:1221 start_codon:yes stop_codon:yes gene_type:complete